MKHILGILTLAAALFAVSVHQATAQVVTFPEDGTWVNVAAGGNPTASNAPVSFFSIDCSSQRNVSIEWTCALNGTDVTNCGVVFVPVAIPGTRPTTPTTAYGFHINRLTTGTTPIVVVTNFDTLGFSRLDLYYLTNNSATMIASNRFRYWVKKGI